MIFSSQLKQRLLMSSIGTLGLFFCIYYSYTDYFKPIFILFNAAIISLALLEYYQLTQNKGFQPLVSLGIGSSIVYVIAVAWSTHHPQAGPLPAFILLGSFLLFFLQFFKQQNSPLGNLAITAFGIVYLTIPLSCGVRINYFFPPDALQDGRLCLAYVLLVSKMCDVGAYFVGKILGKTKLAPLISPKKTLEGALGGLGAALLTSLFFTFLFPTALPLTIGQSFWLGIVIGILAQLGDLAESVLKRDAGVKDSSHLPGLGGILDMVDSLVFTLPLMYLMLQMYVINA